MDEDIRRRLAWIRLWEKTRDQSVVCRRCGISRPTLRKWLKRYGESGGAGLKDRSRRPRTCRPVKRTEALLQQVLDLRQRRLGTRRGQGELLRLHDERGSDGSERAGVPELGRWRGAGCGESIATSTVVPCREIGFNSTPARSAPALSSTQPSMTARGCESWPRMSEGPRETHCCS
jgi:hypothetical protein